jgi:ABC-2 type transport system ATP-binding protein
MTETALETSELGRRYRSKWGLRNCTLRVPKGSITGLVGPNGAGKSTLLRLAAGLSRPTCGSASVFGEAVRPNSKMHLERVGYFDQLRPLYLELRVGETLTFGRKLNSKWDPEAAFGWLSDLDIPLGSRVKDLSLGQQALVALALCLAKSPDLLLLDEPAANLDPLVRRQLFEVLLGTVAERESTILLSSHIISELEPICDRLIILSDSRVQLADTVDAVLAEHRVLVGPPDGAVPSGIEVISNRPAERQSTLLVRGGLEEIGSSWQVLEPDLDEIVRAYLAQRMPTNGSSPRIGAGLGEGSES